MSISLIFPTILTLVMTGITWNNQLFSLFFVTLYFNHIQQLKLYLLHEQQLRLLEMNKALAREDHVSEMRHLIGNVAHDMKTPIAGFLSGIETISSLTRDILLTGGGAVELTPKTPTAKLLFHDSLSADVANKLHIVLSTVENGTEVSIRVSLCRDVPRRRQSVSVSNSKRKTSPKPVAEPKKKSFSFITGGVRVSADIYSLSQTTELNETPGTLDDLERGLSTAQLVSDSAVDSELVRSDHFLHFAVEDTGVGISSELME
eukprot:gene25566-32036_t